MKRIIILLFVTLSLAAISAPADSVQKTVPLTQEQFDSLTHAAALSAQQETVARETANEVLEHYTGTVAWMISILGILISIVAIVAPILINFSYKKQLEKQIEEQHNKFEDRVRNQFNSQNKNLQGRIVNHENIINQNKEKIQQLNKEMLQSQKKSEDAAKEAQISALFSQAYYGDNPDKQIPIYSEIIDRSSNPNGRTEALTLYLARAYNNRGVAYAHKGEFNDAIEDYTKAIKLKPYFAEAYYNRGNAYRHKGEFDKAIKDYTKAIELNPNYAEAYNNRGAAFNDKGEFNNAIKDYTTAIELNPNDATAYYNRGNAYRNKGDFGKAIEDYTTAIKLNPNDATAYNNRALCYIKLAEKETDKEKNKEYYLKALDDCNTGLNLNPDEEVRKLLEEKKRLCEEKLKNLQA